MAFRTANRLVHSAEVWLKRRRRARHDRRRCQSPRTSVRSVGSDVTRRSRAILANARQLLVMTRV